MGQRVPWPRDEWKRAAAERRAAREIAVRPAGMASNFETKGRPSPQDALAYPSRGRTGKIEVVPTKPVATSRDLSLAYSPGVAEPCLEIASDKDLSYKYTAYGTLVAVISNGTTA